jgi:hypothetical protein
MLTKILNALMPKYFGVAGTQWRYALADDYSFSSPHLAGIEFENEWVTIRTGNIRIKTGYAWDGCSPCISVLGLFYIGAPDGAEYLGLPATYHASLVHDALCQWRGQNRVTKAMSVAVFRELMDQVKFPLAGLYAAAVETFGPQDFYGSGLLRQGQQGHL